MSGLRPIVTGLQMILRLFWVVNLALGILFATGRLTELVPLHAVLGLLIALDLLALAIIAILRAPFLLVAAAIVVAVLLPVVGVGQLDWLPGSNHWIVEVIHILVAVAAIALAEILGARLRRAFRAGRGTAVRS